ncbi:Methyltransferase domain-containing protein [Arthrobacter sp. cf158]|uniref:N-6 DNA methylase n=1 Tax=Arthrobacter sp. cf158 TaxID=1761744 RepID=UPI00089A1B05|nr:N-6 DNA methylase [Arthrobacter sp. cf158]SDW99372.1 Methyltransferase domain-containing protein [Arthrobacter sp. cf158]
MSVETVLNTVRKKQLGQYFTDQRVGRLLAALAGAESAKTIIDPMVGSADLLRSCLSVGARPDRVFGLDLDPLAVAQARAALEGVRCTELVVGDAFSTELPSEQFDLVITNPPYIRYQSKGNVDGISVPSAESVRAGLLRAITNRPDLPDAARGLWTRAARSYPGTSDVAVPAWILSAAMVREGGMLAVVAPQAWLSRNYAHAVRELLDGAFDVEAIVEDGDATWFEDAQVRTQLVVARRRPVAARTAGHSVVRARATRDLDTEGSLRGSLASEAAVATALRAVTASSSTTVTTGLTAHVEHDLSVASSGQTVHVPARVTVAIGTGPAALATRTLASYGWRAGQGLRSGANDFFYVSVVDGVVCPAPRWGVESLPIPPECLLPAVRRQSDLGDHLAVDASLLQSRVVNLRGWVTAADLKRMGSGEVQVLPAAVGRWISQVASTPLSAKDPTKLFPDLAAVATNSKMDRTGRPVRFWYQLPELTVRHRPALLLGRVCGGRPRTYLNPSRTVIDANFSGFWPTEPDAMPAEALLALLNSSWVWANLEATCTVLGGGALKIEATDLRRMALPVLSAEDVAKLSRLGRDAMMEHSGDLQLAIDEVVAGALAPGQWDELRPQRLQALAEQALSHRSRGKWSSRAAGSDVFANRVAATDRWG